MLLWLWLGGEGEWRGVEVLTCSHFFSTQGLHPQLCLLAVMATIALSWRLSLYIFLLFLATPWTSAAVKGEDPAF